MHFCVHQKLDFRKNTVGREDKFSLQETTTTHKSFSQDSTCLWEVAVLLLANISDILHCTPLNVMFWEMINFQLICVLFNENTQVILSKGL